MQLSIRGVLNRLDGMSPWAFTGILYLARWIVVLPLAALLRLVGVRGGLVSGAAAELVIMVLLDPLLETILECTIPYWLIRKCGRRSGPRPWGFVALSAAIMVLLHIGAWPAAILPAAVTGVFLAYTYGHFAANDQRRAIVHTWAFHSSINIIGWVIMVRW
jgi:hypothetical protein